MKSSLYLTFIIGMLSFGLSGTRAADIYVDQFVTSGTKDGTSWATAYKSLPAALADANSNGQRDTIWLRSGRYSISQAQNRITAPCSLIGEPGTTIDCPWTLEVSSTETYFKDLDFAGSETHVLGTRSDLWFHTCSFRGSRKGAVKSFGAFDEQDLCMFACLFISNGTHSDGGAILVEDNYWVKIHSCQFLFNKAEKEAGAIYGESNRDVQILDCEFSGNTAKYRGGAIELVGFGDVQIKACEFSGNKAEQDGGAIDLWNNGDVQINDCEFSGNKAERDGGAIDLWVFGDVEIMDCEFSGNKTEQQGGAINLCAYGDIQIMDSEFSGNTSEHYGGAIDLLADGAAQIMNSLFQENTAMDGGAFHACVTFDVEILDCQFLENRAIRSGGAFLAKWNGDIQFQDCQFVGNTAQSAGGALHASQNDEMEILDCQFIGNEASEEGGALVAREFFAMRLQDCQFRANFAEGNGGAVHLQDCLQAIFCRTFFDDNQAAGRGGAVSLQETGQSYSQSQFVDTAWLVNCILRNNRANTGGAIDSAGSDLRIANCTLIHNLAVEFGGIHICSTGRPKNLFLENSILWENRDLVSRIPYRHQCNRKPDRTTHCCIEDSLGMSASWGTGVTNANPLLNSNGSLRSGSPCIDRGDLGCYPNLLLSEDPHSGTNLARDIAGKARLTGPEIDMGAQEMGVLSPVLLD